MMTGNREQDEQRRQEQIEHCNALRRVHEMSGAFDSAQTNVMKTLFRSTTVQGALIALVSLLVSIIGIDLQKAEVDGIITGLSAAWPQLLAVATSFGIIWRRIVAFDFEKSVFLTGTFWMAVLTALFSVLGAAGAPVEGMDTLVEQIIAAVAQLGPVVGAIIAAFGRWKAKKMIKV
jgi:hypothetical protein